MGREGKGVGLGRLAGAEEMWNTAGLAGQACAHLPDSERHGLQMCQLGGSGVQGKEKSSLGNKLYGELRRILKQDKKK